MPAAGGGLALACGTGVMLPEGSGAGTVGFGAGAAGLRVGAGVGLSTGAAVGFLTGAAGVCTGARPVHAKSALQSDNFNGPFAVVDCRSERARVLVMHASA